MSDVVSNGRSIALVLLACVGCGKPEPVATTPQREPIADAPVVHTQPPAATATLDTSGAPRVALTAEFHRTRVGAGTGYWVLGMVHNHHAHAITNLRAEVRLLDAEDKLVGQAEATFPGRYAAGDQAPVAVHVAAPVEHERLELVASAIESPDGAPELPLTLEYDPPARAELGGWFVLGAVGNTGTQPLDGIRLEVVGLDRSGHLLGVDWLVLDALGPGEVRPFDLGELRYEQAPASFALELRGP